MKKITGIGGVFIKAKDLIALAAWYDEFPGIGFNDTSYVNFSFTDEEGKLTPL